MLTTLTIHRITATIIAEAIRARQHPDSIYINPKITVVPFH